MIKLKTLVAFFVTVTLSACASLREITNSRTRVQGDSGVVSGQEVARGDAAARQAVLLLITRGPRLSTCTGTLIERTVILTAAHCVANAVPANVRVFFRTRLNEIPLGPEISAQKILLHHDYKNEPQNFSDLALVKLSLPAPQEYQTLPLAEKDVPGFSDEVVLLGYGITDETKKDALILRKILKSFKADFTMKPGFIGIKQDHGGFCRGDSGAPVLIDVSGKLQIFGVNSFTIGLEENKECHTASVAMHVGHFHEWIRTNAATL